MTQQTQAQRLADELDAYHTAPHHKEAAAELRRQHAEIERKSDAIQRLWKERDDLRAANAQLLEALESVDEAIVPFRSEHAPDWWKSARAAILVRADEREACAKLIESRKTGANELMDTVRDTEARAIRARGQA
jgi:hypothetical protein